MPASQQNKKREKTGETTDKVGPQTYNPVHPSHEKSPYYHAVESFSKEQRLPKTATVPQPGPANYKIKGHFDKAHAKPRFAMGIKNEKMEKKPQDFPSPGDYETD